MLEPTKRLRDLLQKASSLSQEEAFYFVFSIKKNQDFIIELNTQKQMFEDSVNADNVILGTYTPNTYQAKINRFGTFPRSITLFETGELYDSYKVKVLKNGGFEISANTIKDGEDLRDRFGEIEGLTNENLNILIESIVEDVRLYVRLQLGLQN